MTDTLDRQELIRRVADYLEIDAGLVSYEYPGCVVIPHADRSGNAYWFGTANPTWQGDLVTPEGARLDTLETHVESTCTDPGRIALGIARALLGVPPTMFRAGTFSIDTMAGPVTLPGWTFDDTWNGFACPAFERAEADRLMRALSDPNAEADAHITYDEARDAFLVRTYEADADVSEGHDIATPDGVRHVYSIGAYAWTWTEIEAVREDEPTTTHPIGCVCEACSAAYERDKWDPRDRARD